MDSKILLIDDDEEEFEIVKEALDLLENKKQIECFSSAKEFLHYFRQTTDSPFLILCDLNLPKETGFDLKKHLLNNSRLNYKSVPFIYWSTSASEQQVKHAYDLQAQGFFLKPSSLSGLCTTLKTIINYWEKSTHPKLLFNNKP